MHPSDAFFLSISKKNAKKSDQNTPMPAPNYYQIKNPSSIHYSSPIGKFLIAH
jgi:hypothetical protein